MTAIFNREQMDRLAAGIAEVRSESWIYGHLALLRLRPEVQAMMSIVIPEKERLTFSFALFISILHHDLQFEIAKKVVDEKMSLRRAQLYVKQVAKKDGLTASTNIRALGFDGTVSPSVGDKKEKKVTPLVASQPTPRITLRIQRSTKPLTIPLPPIPRDGSLELAYQVLITMFYVDGEPYVNLSRKRLQEVFPSKKVDEMVKSALEIRHKHWGMASKGGQGVAATERLIKLMGRLQRTYGSSRRKFGDVLKEIENRDFSEDPVSLKF